MQNKADIKANMHSLVDNRLKYYDKTQANLKVEIENFVNNTFGAYDVAVNMEMIKGL